MSVASRFLVASILTCIAVGAHAKAIKLECVWGQKIQGVVISNFTMIISIDTDDKVASVDRLNGDLPETAKLFSDGGAYWFSKPVTPGVVMTYRIDRSSLELEFVMEKVESGVSEIRSRFAGECVILKTTSPKI